MYFLNRSILIVKAKQPFIDWINSTTVPGDSSIITLDEVNREPNVYLIPEYDSEAELNQLLPSAIECIWDAELSGWCLDASTWPKEQSMDAFHKWFDLMVGGMVHDLLEDPLVKEEL